MRTSVFKIFCLGSLIIIFLIYTALFSSIFYYFNMNTFLDTIFSERTLYSTKLSIKCAFLSSLASLILAIPSGYMLSRYNFFGKRVIDTLLEFPLIVSPSALGALILIFFSNPYGLKLQENFVNLVFDVKGIILAQFITTLGLTVRFVKISFDDVPKRYEDVVRSYGISHFKAFLKVVMPNAKVGIFYAWILGFAKSMGEFGATITVAGSMQLKTETLPISIYMRLSGADLNGAVVMILILIIISFFILYIMRIFNRSNSYA